jgi:hypothetical protein
MKKFIAVGLLCVASAAMAKPELSDEGFGRLAGQWFATEQCAIQGQISAETAAYGKHILREAQERYEVDKVRFGLVVNEVAKKFKKGLDPKLCNSIGMEIEDLRLQRKVQAEAEAQRVEQQRREAQAQAQLEQQRRLDAQVQAQREEQQRREAQMAVEMEAQRREQELAADAAYRRREMEAMAQQLKQIGQQFREFGNSVQPRTTNCTRTFMGVSCTTD